jgi:hypothetical protein
MDKEARVRVSVGDDAEDTFVVSTSEAQGVTLLSLRIKDEGGIVNTVSATINMDIVREMAKGLNSLIAYMDSE